MRGRDAGFAVGCRRDGTGLDMGRHLPRLVTAAAVVAAAIVLGPRLTMPAIDGAGAIAVAALTTSAVCLVVAALALIRSRLATREIDRMARTLDATIRRVSADSDRTRSAIAEFSRIDERREAGAPIPMPLSEEPPPSNVVPLPTPSKRVHPAPAQTFEFTADDLAAQLPLPLSLEPIVDVTSHAATAFDVHAHLRLPGGDEHVVRRLDDSGLASGFASALVDAALVAIRRQPGNDAETLPLHVAVPAKFFSDESETSRLLEAFRINPGLAETIVFSLPPDASAGEAASQSINRLARAGATFAVEAWPEGQDPVGHLAILGATIVKLPAARLLDDQKRGRMAGVDILDAAEGRLTLIATGVASEDQVLRLLDIGVELMSGPALSAPRRLKDLAWPTGANDRRMTPNG